MVVPVMVLSSATSMRWKIARFITRRSSGVASRSVSELIARAEQIEASGLQATAASAARR
jgi:hypothetical protein